MGQTLLVRLWRTEPKGSDPSGSVFMTKYAVGKGGGMGAAMISIVGFKRSALTAFVIASMLVLGVLVGCSGSSSQASSSAESSESEEVLAVSDVAADAAEIAEAEMLKIGEDVDGALNMVITNELDKKITDIAFAAAGSEDEPAYLMTSDQVWKSGDQAKVFFEDAGKDVNYDVYVKVKGADYTLHNMKLDGVEELSICFEDGVAYATFERDGNAISTLRDETDLAEQAAAAEAEQAEEAAGEEYYEEEYTDEGYYEEPAQEEDGCVEGGVQLR